MNRPFRLSQDTANTLEIVDDNGQQLCQFYCDGYDVDEQTRLRAEFVLRAVNRHEEELP